MVDSAPGHFANCTDKVLWYFEDEDYVWLCSDFEGIDDCTGPPSVPPNIASHTVNNFTVAEACCSCPGGGTDVTNIASTLLSWRLMVYGNGGGGNNVAAATGNESASYPPQSPSDTNTTPTGNSTSSDADRLPMHSIFALIFACLFLVCC